MSCVAAPATLFPDDMSCFLFPGVHAVYRGCSHRCVATHTHIDGLEHRSHARPPVATLGGMEELGIDPKLITITSLRNMMSGDVSSYTFYSLSAAFDDGPDVSGGTVVCTSVNVIIVKALGLYFLSSRYFHRGCAGR